MDIPGRLPLETLNNTRTLDGIRTADGRTIRKGMLIRSGHLYGASQSDLALLRDTVGLVIDLRSGQERAEKPDPSFGAALVELPIYDMQQVGVTRDEVSQKEAFERAARDPKDARDYMAQVYRAFITEQTARSRYARFLRLLLTPPQKAVLWHCTAGKDRTGFAAILLLEILGVDRDTILTDYLRTNDCLKEECAALTVFLGEKLGGLTPQIEEALDDLFLAQRTYFDALYETAARDFGSMDGFIRSGLGITEAEREQLRKLYLTN